VKRRERRRAWLLGSIAVVVVVGVGSYLLIRAWADNSVALDIDSARSWPDLDGLTPCSGGGSGGESDKSVGLATKMRLAVAWLRFEPDELVDPGDLEENDNGVVHSASLTDGGTVLPVDTDRDVRTEEVQVYPEGLEIAAEESARGATVYLLVTGANSLSVPLAVTERPDGTFLPVGSCQNAREYLEAFAENQGLPDMSSALELLVSDPSASTAYVSFERTYVSD
jgi:hypothetical protein